MEINLEKIEIVKDRTGSTYAQARDALERSNGSVVDAIIDIEESLNKEYADAAGASLKDSPVFAKIKEIVEKGNVRRILITKAGKTVVDFPLTAGVIGAVLVPWGAIFGIAAAVGTQCEFAFVDEDGNATDINGKVVGFYDKAKETITSGIDKAQDIFKGGADKAHDFDVDDVKEAFTKGSAKLMEAWDKLEKSGKIDEVKDVVENVAKKAVDTAKNIAEKAAKHEDKASEEAKSDFDLSFDIEIQEEFDNDKEI